MDKIEMENKLIEKEINEAIKNGAKVVGLDIFDRLDSLELDQFNIDESNYTIDLYLEALKQLKDLGSELKELYLTTARSSDIIDNQTIEAEDPFMISLYEKYVGEEAIDILLKNYGSNLTKDVLIKTHDVLVLGTTSSDKVGLRTTDRKFVGNIVNGKRNISYIPLKSELIDEALYRFLTYYNYTINDNKQDYECLITPIIYHGLLAALQLFDDGNTRLSRLVQTVEIWGMMNKITSNKIDLPMLYASRQYYPYRRDYRDLIKDLVVEGTNEAWNEWIKFNLRRFQESLFVTEQHIEKVKKLK